MQDSDAEAGSVCGCKVGRAAATYGLSAVHGEFARRWEDEEESVRGLAEAFNRRVLRAGVERAGRTPLDGEIENRYRVLTDDDVDAGSRTQARERLRRDGVPVEDLEDAFVSHQTMYRHLTDCLDAAREPAHEDADSRIEAWRDRLRSLQTRTEQVTRRGLDQLRSAGAVTVGSFEVYVEVNVQCEDCGRFYTAEEFLDRGRCDCEADDASP